MSGVKAKQLTLYEQADDTKEFRIVTGPSGVAMDFKKAWGDAAEINYGLSMSKASLGGQDIAAKWVAQDLVGSTNAAAVVTEQARALAAELVNTTAITAEASTARAAEVANGVLIGDEKTRAIAKEAQIDATHSAYASSNDAALASEIARASGAEAANGVLITANSASIVSEASTARAAEAVNAQAVVDEKTRALVAEGLNATAIATEAAAARAAEAGLQSQITNLLANTDQISLNSLAEIVSDYKSVDASHVQRLSSIESQLTALLALHA